MCEGSGGAQPQIPLKSPPVLSTQPRDLKLPKIAPNPLRETQTRTEDPTFCCGNLKFPQKVLKPSQKPQQPEITHKDPKFPPSNIVEPRASSEELQRTSDNAKTSRKVPNLHTGAPSSLTEPQAHPKEPPHPLRRSQTPSQNPRKASRSPPTLSDHPKFPGRTPVSSRADPPPVQAAPNPLAGSSQAPPPPSFPSGRVPPGAARPRSPP